jgi:hypothetical protein
MDRENWMARPVCLACGDLLEAGYWLPIAEAARLQVLHSELCDRGVKLVVEVR